MISLRLTRWFLGYVRFSIIGGSMERFLNYCARSGINLWDIKAGENRGACVSTTMYCELRHCAYRANVKLKAQERHGLLFATKRVRKRRGILAGMLLFVAVIFLLSFHIWSIGVNGNTSIPTEKIESELTSMGITPGILKSKVQPQVIQQKLMIKFPQIGWLSVNTHGCTIEVRLQEKTDIPEMTEDVDQKICNVKASQTGQILFMNIYTGTAQVKEGDAVVAGQLLINCVVEDDLGNTTLKHAEGKIIAATERELTTEVELKRRVTVPSGKVVIRKSLNLFRVCVPLNLVKKPKGNYKVEGVYTDLKLMNSTLPIGIYEEKWTEERTMDITLTNEQAIEEAKKQMEQKQKSELKDAKIISVSARHKIADSKLIYTAAIKCEENIAQESEIMIK